MYKDKSITEGIVDGLIMGILPTIAAATFWMLAVCFFAL